MFSSDDDERLIYRFSLCIVLQSFQQMCGGNLISVYASTVFESNLHQSFQDPCRLCPYLEVPLLFYFFFAIDRLGHRALFMISGTGMAICMAAMAVTTSFPADNKHAPIVFTSLIFLFNLFHPIGFMGGNFFAPVRLRIAMASISTAIHWLWNFASDVDPGCVGYYWIPVLYYVRDSLSVYPSFRYFFYPETMNRNLEFLNHIFRDASSPGQIVSMARYLPQREVTEANFTAQSEKGDGTSVETKENA